MFKEQFEPLNIEEKVSYVNTCLKQGDRLYKIEKRLGYKEGSLRRQIARAGYYKDTKLKAYVKTDKITKPKNKFTPEELAVLDKLIQERLILKETLSYIEVREDEYVKTSVLVNKSIWQRFIDYCKTQTLEQGEILTVALKEFLENINS